MSLWRADDDDDDYGDGDDGGWLFSFLVVSREVKVVWVYVLRMCCVASYYVC